MDKKYKILIVDDDEPTRTMYAEVFHKKGFEVAEAKDGVDGMDKATKDVPDVIFTGIIMPRMDGFGLMEALKKNVATSDIPVVISSHMGREEDQKRAQEMGAKDFITRDFNTPNQVVERISAIFNSKAYRIKISSSELDAPQLSKDMHLKENLKCAACGGELVLELKPSDVKNNVFFAKFTCAQCGKVQE